MARRLFNDYIVIVKGDVTIVIDFDDDNNKECLEFYVVLELLGLECVMLGADSVDTLRETHSSWFRRKQIVLRREEVLIKECKPMPSW